MKKILVVILCSFFLFPLYARGSKDNLESSSKKAQAKKPKNPTSFERRHFEFGIDAGVGLDNDSIKISDLFKKEIIVDLAQLKDDIGDNGLNINLGVPVGFFLNMKNIEVAKGIWDFGYSCELGGRIHINAPKSFFDLMTEGNIEKRNFEGTFSASGGLFLGNGISASAKYGKLRLGIKPAVFTPLLFIPKSGINYKFVTDDAISLSTSGVVKVYHPITEDGRQDFRSGADVSLNGEYEILRFLDAGVSVYNIPLSPAVMRNHQLFSMSNFEVNIMGEDLMNGNAPDLPPLDFNQKFASLDQKVMRPFKMDFYARLKPFSNELLVVKPNIGFTVDTNDVDVYFNTGIEGQLNLINMFILSLSMGLEESIWTHRLGLAFNFRAFELDLAASMRSESFTGSFLAQGVGVEVGVRFGW